MRLFRRARTEGEMDEELRAHIQNRADELERSGLARAEAERRARVEFGGFERYKEECRDALGTRFLETLAQDVGFGLRMLRKSAGFTAVAALTLALGIGANTAVFSAVYAALIRPLPYSQPDRLITLSEVRSGLTQYWDASYPDYLDWTRQSKSFQSLAGFDNDAFVFHGKGEPQFILGAQITPNFLSTLGVKPLLGRDFTSGEDVPSGPNVAILSYGFWLRQFGGDPKVIGRSIQLDTHSVQVIGVLPREFEFAPMSADVWVPIHLRADVMARRNLRWLSVVGRLAPGATAAQARAEMGVINRNLAAAYPQENAAIQLVMISLRERIIGKIRPLLLILFGAVGFVLLIACANIANLLMVRAAGRRKEFAVRSALGASRGRLISQLLAESLMLAIAGSVPGFFLAEWGTSLLIAAIPQAQLASMPFLRDAHANPTVLGFLCLTAILTSVIFGLAPALQISEGRAADRLKEESRASASGTRSRLRNALVVVEIAFSLVLLVGAGLMVKSLEALLARNPGFDSRNLLTFAVDLPSTSYPNAPDFLRFDRQFTGRIRNLPGIEGIASNSVIPLTGDENTIRFVIEGQSTAVGREDECAIRGISANYFSVMKIPLVAGRFFDDSADSPTSLPHIIANQAWVNRYLPGKNPIGKRIRFTNSPTQPYREIVGVVENIVDVGLDSPEEPGLFQPLLQGARSYIRYIVRTAASPASTAGAIRAALHEEDPQLVMIQPLTMDQIIDQSPSVFLRRYPSYLIGSFAALALLLAMIGLYGLISYSVSQRTRELGIRIALGAQPRDIMRLVVGEGARLAVIGIVVGMVAALALTQLMHSLLFGVSAEDPVTFAAVAAILALAAVAACSIPARRAMRSDPMAALHYE